VVLAKKTPKKNNDVDAYKHKKETHKNAVPVGLASYDTAKPKPIRNMSMTRRSTFSQSQRCR